MTAEYQNLIVAVDGGGSTCRVNICQMDGTLVAQAQGGAANLTTDFDAALQMIQTTIDQAYKFANLPVERKINDYACLGLAGAKLDGLATWLEKQLNFKDVMVLSDQDITVQGAMGDEDGTIVSIGTGSFFISHLNTTKRHIGGWGMHLGDECSGAYLGRSLLRKSLHAYDGLIEHSPLTQQIMNKFNGSPQQMIIFARDATPQDFGAFSPQILEAFNQSDPVATVIINEAVVFLSQTLDNMNAKASGALYMLGGLGAIYQDLLSQDYQDLCQPAKANAMAGAIQLAQHKWGIKI